MNEQGVVTRTLAFLNRHASPLLAGALFVGLFVPPLAAALRPLFAPSVVVLLAVTMLRIDWGRTMAALAAWPLPALAIAAWLLVGAPVGVAAIIAALGLGEPLATIAVLMASSPPLIAVSAFALMVGLDAGLVLVVTVATTLVLPLVQPPLLLWLLGLDLPVSLAALMGRLGLFVGSATGMAIAIRVAAGPERVRRWHEPFGGVAVLSLIVFGIAVMDGLAAEVAAAPMTALRYLVAVFAANWGLQAAGALVFWPAGRGVALIAAMVGGNRNLAILAAVLADQAPVGLFLWLALGQFPMYLFPAVLGGLYRRLLKRELE